MLIITVDFAIFEEAFKVAKRNDFSERGLKELFAYLEEDYIQQEMDVIDICSNYAEYESYIDYCQNTGSDDADEQTKAKFESELIKTWANGCLLKHEN